LTNSEAVIGLPEYELIDVDEVNRKLRVSVRYTGPRACPDCGGTKLRLKDRRLRHPRHASWGDRHCEFEVETSKWLCRQCGRSFWDRLPGILPRKRASEPFRRSVFRLHRAGINRSRLGQLEGIGSATVERWSQDFFRLEAAKRSGRSCPRILGIDEHFFSRRQGFATTFCDLKNHSVYDVVLGRSEQALEAYLEKLPGRDEVRLVCMDLSSTYRAIVGKYFPKARIVTDRFHVIRLINHHFLSFWRELDPTGSKNRGLLSLMRRHQHNLKPEQKQRLDQYLASQPVLALCYSFKQGLCSLLLCKNQTAKQCRQLIPRLLKAIEQLRRPGPPQLLTLGETLHNWQEEIARMWRFTRNNGITEGFHTKMEVLQHQAYGFRNFQNYRLRVKVLCC